MLVGRIIPVCDPCLIYRGNWTREAQDYCPPCLKTVSLTNRTCVCQKYLVELVSFELIVRHGTERLVADEANNGHVYVAAALDGRQGVDEEVGGGAIDRERQIFIMCAKER